MKDDQERLRDILDEIRRIKRHLPSSRRRFDDDEVIQAALTRWIQNIGEAASRVSTECRSQHPDIPWREMAGMRHRVVHDYAFVNLDVCLACLHAPCQRAGIASSSHLERAGP